MEREYKGPEQGFESGTQRIGGGAVKLRKDHVKLKLLPGA
jgi:hypothetical protein